MTNKKTTKDKVIRNLHRIHQEMLESVWCIKDYEVVEGFKDDFGKIENTISKKMYDEETIKDAVIDMLNFANIDIHEEAIAYLERRLKNEVNN